MNGSAYNPVLRPSSDGFDDFFGVSDPCRSTTDWKTPRLRRRSVRVAKKPSTALSQEAEVGVKWNVQRGRRASHFGPRVLVGGPSRDSPIDQRIATSLVVQGLDGEMDGSVEIGGVGEGLVGQLKRLEIVPDNLDVVPDGTIASDNAALVTAALAVFHI
jgi:hypothetical protein